MSDLNTNLLSKTGYTAGQLQAAAHSLSPGNGFTDFQAFVDAENAYNLNSLFILAHAAVESAWGNSYYGKTRNNLFGFNAVDSNPDLASSYVSQHDSILKYADFLSHYYLYPGQVYYGGAPSPHGIFVHYSSSHDSEAETVVGIMNNLQAHIGGNPVPAPSPTPAPAPSGNVYTAVGGDNMSRIAGSHGMSLAQLEALNPSAGHPAGNFGNIWPGDQFQLAGGNAPAPAPTNAPKYHTVTSADGARGLSGIASDNGISLATIEAMNPNAGHPAGNFGNIWPGDQIRVA